MPGVERVTLDRLAAHVEPAARLGIPASRCSRRRRPRRRTPRGARRSTRTTSSAGPPALLKRELPEVGLVGDVALDPYTDHGHDGVIRDGYVANDETVEMLGRQAVVQAAAGIDVIAPSDMMDGRVGAIRAALDAEGLIHTRIMTLRGEIRLGVLRPVPRRGRLRRRAEGRQEDVSDGPRQRRRGAARGGHGPRRGGGHGDGQARHAVSRHRAAGERAVRRADLRLPGVGRVRDDHGGGRARLARPRARHAGEPARLQARRGGGRADLFRARGGAAAGEDNTNGRTSRPFPVRHGRPTGRAWRPSHPGES